MTKFLRHSRLLCIAVFLGACAGQESVPGLVLRDGTYHCEEGRFSLTFTKPPQVIDQAFPIGENTLVIKGFAAYHPSSKQPKFIEQVTYTHFPKGTFDSLDRWQALEMVKKSVLAQIGAKNVLHETGIEESGFPGVLFTAETGKERKVAEVTAKVLLAGDLLYSVMYLAYQDYPEEEAQAFLKSFQILAANPPPLR